MKGIYYRGGSLDWENFNPTVNISKCLPGIKVKCHNDAKLAGLREMWQGAGKNYKNLFLITLGTATGGGIVVDGKILSGYAGLAGEFSYLHQNLVDFVDSDYKEEVQFHMFSNFVSATGIVNTTKFIMKKTDIPSPLRDMKDFTAKDVTDYAEKGDKLALLGFEKFCRYLGKTISNLTLTVNPEVFVLGGGVSAAGDFLVKRVEKYFRHYFVIGTDKYPKITVSALGNDAGIYGSDKYVLG